MKPKVWLSTLFVLSLMANAPVYGAEPDTEQERWKPLNVVIVQVPSYVREPQDLFQERTAVREARSLGGLWTRRLEERFGSHDMVRLVKHPELTQRIMERRVYRELIPVARERFALGLARYEALDVNAALQHLNHAARLFEQADGYLTDARVMADVEFYRGLAFLEAKQLNRAHMAFRRMWFLDPARTFEKNYYPASTEETLSGALLDLGRLGENAFSARLPDRWKVLGLDIGVDVWVLATLVGEPAEPHLRLSILEVRRGVPTADEHIPLENDDLARDIVDRLVSGWYACAVEKESDPFLRPPASPSWYLDIGYSHTVMLTHKRTLEPFHSPGVVLGLTWEAFPFVHFFAQAIHMGSVPDSNWDLLETFVTSRLAAGAGLTLGGSSFRAFIRFGLELAMTFSEIEMTRDVNCKHFGTLSERCDKSRLFVVDPPGIWFGLTAALGFRWAFLDHWYLMTSLELTSYVARADLIKDLNFPLSTSLGFGHRF